MYSDDIVLTCNLRSVISDMFFRMTLLYAPYVHLVKLNYLLLFFFFLCDATDMVK